jgi:hypothetical protein
MEKNETINLLAEHFTGPLVVDSSIRLQMGGSQAKMAKLFFDTRDKLGIRGYATKDEAAVLLRSALEQLTPEKT